MKNIVTFCLVLGLLCGASSYGQESAKSPPTKKAGTTTKAKTAKKKAAPNPALAEIEDVPGLPRVLLIGDSISIGYTLAVREQLNGHANVHRINTNGGPTTRGLEMLKDWLGNSKWDVIHFNWGLHDLKYVAADGVTLVESTSPEGRQNVSIDQYEKNLRELVAAFQKSGAKLIWCATTPVPEGSSGRVKGDEVKYNQAAEKVMKAAGIPINDLYAHANAGSEGFQLPANVHYSPAGSEYLAKKVAAEIKLLLPTK